MTLKLNPIDDATLEAYVKQVVDVFTSTPVKEFSAHDVTKQARALHPTDFIEHKADVVHALMLNLISGGLDYERESVTVNGVSYWLYKHIEPANQVVTQTAQPTTQPPAIGLAIQW